MSRKLAIDAATARDMKRMGKLIMRCRKERSLRNIAEPCGIAASQLQSIERGILAPTADVYTKLIQTLNPTEKDRKTLDCYYMSIRKTPPPDICEAIIANQILVDAVRCVDGIILNDEQSAAIERLFASFATKNTRGETDNG